MRRSIAFLLCCCIASILSMAIYYVTDKNYELAIPTIVTLSSDQMAGEGYTDAPAADDSDIWEDGDKDFSYADAPENTETVTEIDFPIDINTASADELVYIKGIGGTIAGNIISYRDEHGYFYSLEELLNVDGIGDKKLEDIREFIFISPEIAAQADKSGNPDEDTEKHDTGKDIQILHIELNSATEEDLMQISGVGESLASAIVEYADTTGFNSVSDLMNIDGIGEKRLENIAPYVYVEKSVPEE